LHEPLRRWCHCSFHFLFAASPERLESRAENEFQSIKKCFSFRKVLEFGAGYEFAWGRSGPELAAGFFDNAETGELKSEET